MMAEIGTPLQRFRARCLRCVYIAPLLLASVSFSAAVARSQDSAIIANAHDATQKFVDDFALIRYDEYQSQQKLRKNGKIAYEENTVFDSIIRMHVEDDGLFVDEQQIVVKQPRQVDKRPLLSTRGFSALAMILHPYYASSFQFTVAGSEQLQGRTVTRIDFVHIPDKPSPWLYQILGGDRPLDLAGSAWVDPRTGEMVRIEASVGSKETDLGLKELHAELDYAPVLLRDEDTPRMLPASATIDFETPRRHWRNTYSFKDYRRYRVAAGVEGDAAR